MFLYFGYGSNMDLTSLRAKGVEVESSTVGTLHGWRLRFNVAHYFRHEGGVGNIEKTGLADDRVMGVVHRCRDRGLARLDEVESCGVGYDRIEVDVDTAEGTVKAFAYVGKKRFIDDSCLPTQRYLNILLSGAGHAGIDAGYVESLRRHPVHENEPPPPFEAPPGDWPEYDADSLAEHPALTALGGYVFDMRGARWEHEHLLGLFGGKDMTLFHLQRMDSSDGSESLDDVRLGRLDGRQRRYLDGYLHEYDKEYEFVGRYAYG